MTKAESAALKVRIECGIIDHTEFNLKEIILGRRIFYQEKPLLGKESEIVTNNGRSIITINSAIEYESKKRFVAAHELGHYEMHRELEPIIVDTESDLINWYKSGPHEIEANEFAAEFLMPGHLFRAECAGRYFGPNVIDHLSEVFQVSKTATILRFIKEGNHPICIVYCFKNQMKWWKKSNDFKYFLNFAYGLHPPSGSVANEIFEQNKSYYDDERKQKIFKSTWFELQEYEQDKVFYEYCLYVPSYSYVISVIWEY